MTTALGLLATMGASALATTVATAAEPTPVHAEDFEDGSFAPWTTSGGPMVSVVDADGDMALQVANRANDYDGIQSPPLL